MAKMKVKVPPPEPLQSDSASVDEKWQEATAESVAELPTLRRRLRWLQASRATVGGHPDTLWAIDADSESDDWYETWPEDTPPDGDVEVRSAVRPLDDRVVIRPRTEEQATASGLVLAPTSKDELVEGEVLAVGPGRLDDKGDRIPIDIAVGNHVIFSAYGGVQVRYRGYDYTILSARDVLALVEDRPKSA